MTQPSLDIANLEVKHLFNDRNEPLTEATYTTDGVQCCTRIYPGHFIPVLVTQKIRRIRALIVAYANNP